MSYTAPSNTILAGGRYVQPTWRRAMTPNTWAAVPGNTLSDIDPEDDPAINPNYPDNAPWRAQSGQRMVIDAWCGGCYDQDDDVLWLPLSGGHADYAGNEPYRVSLRQETCNWEMVRPPSGAVGNTGVLNDGLEASGVYFDGRPRAIHSYNKCVYVPNLGPVIAVQGNTAWSGQSGTRDTLIYNAETGESSRMSPAGSTASSGGGAAYDPSRHCIYWRGRGTEQIQQYDIETDAWTAVQTSGRVAMSGDTALAYCESLDIVLLIHPTIPDRVGVMNPATGAMVEPTVTGSTVGAAALSGQMQPVWVESLGGFAAWDNADNTGVINLLSPGADPYTDAWTISQLPVSGATTPTAKTTQGTYGRFFYSKKLNGFGVVNSTTQPIYFYSLG